MALVDIHWAYQRSHAPFYTYRKNNKSNLMNPKQDGTGFTFVFIFINK